MKYKYKEDILAEAYKAAVRGNTREQIESNCRRARVLVEIAKAMDANVASIRVES